MTATVLFVDDEPGVLRSLRRVFHRSDIEAHFAESGKQGLEALGEQPVDVVVSDMRMPGMDGYEFLSEVRRKHPSVIRVVMSGYAEKKAILKGVMDGTVKAYLTKPWDNDALKGYITHVCNLYNGIRDTGIREMVARTEHLPVPSAAYEKLVSLIQQDRDASEIAAYLKQVPGYAARILRIANSSFYGTTTSSIKQATVFLGLDTIKNIVLSSEIFESLKQGFDDARRIEQLWDRAALSSKVLHHLYRHLHAKRMPEEFAAAGLLHNVGELVLLRNQPDAYQAVMERWESKPEKPLERHEQEAFGINHAHLGGYLLDWWNLPACHIEACLYHHDPLNRCVHSTEMVTLIHIADALACHVTHRSEQPAIGDDVYGVLGAGGENLKREVERLDQEGTGALEAS